jgi:hypothetical protein
MRAVVESTLCGGGGGCSCCCCWVGGWAVAAGVCIAAAAAAVSSIARARPSKVLLEGSAVASTATATGFEREAGQLFSLGSESLNIKSSRSSSPASASIRAVDPGLGPLPKHTQNSSSSGECITPPRPASLAG